ncbi:hypothetical protein SEPCBS119000_003238 [Sporothrix epigloea]|uniref:Uncharacterized protein n=1 Tax=Sporothrix epigloea TaxID=1892477 RepID=A0ABP0DNB0_9PEZI
MAIKTTAAAALQRDHRRRFRQHAMVPLGKHSSQYVARSMADKRIKHDQHKIKLQQRRQQKLEQAMLIQAFTSASATPEPSTPPPESSAKQSLQHILGRNFDDKDRSAADVLASLYQKGLLNHQTPAASECSVSGTTTPVCESRFPFAVSSASTLSNQADGDDVEPSVVALPSMQQTEVMLETWRSEECKKNNENTIAAEEQSVEEQAAPSPVTPALSATSFTSSRALSTGSPALEDGRSNTFHRHALPSGPPPPPYDQWRKSIAVADLTTTTTTTSLAAATPTAVPLSQPQPRALRSPFATFEPNYFCSRRTTQNDGRDAAGLNGMPSPPQSPTDTGRSGALGYSNKPTLPSLPPLSSTLPTPPQSFSASMQPQQQPAYQPHMTFRPRYSPQFELPAPMPIVRRRSNVNEDCSTTVLTLPSLGSAIGRRSTMPALPSMASMVKSQADNLPTRSHYVHSHQDLSPRMATKLVARRERMSASAASSPAATPGPCKKTALSKPHCNVKYETAELDFIMYQRTTKNRAWDDVTASFNAALPRLRQYADMDYARVGSAAASSPDTKAGLDRYRARPERTTPGLQASYYRQRLALPLLNENGLLVFDDATNKQLFTEVMVRDDKSRKKMRRITSQQAPSTAAGPLPVAAAAAAAAAGAKGVSPDDARVHLVLYFPERVTYYDYWFVSEEDKALARQRTYERNVQRHQRGLPSWHPGNDDPESGILTRSKE